MGKAKTNYQEQLYNLQAAQLAAQVANNAAQQEFLRMRFTELEKPQFQFMSEIEKERLAFQQAQQAFQEAFQTASLTGVYNGQQTVAEQQRQFENAATIGQLTGFYNGDMTAAERNAAFLREIQAGGLTGYYNGGATLGREQFEANTALDLLKLRAGLRGPRDAFAFARSINATGTGLRGILDAASGLAPFQAYSGLQAPLYRADIAGLAPDVFRPPVYTPPVGVPAPVPNPTPGLIEAPPQGPVENGTYIPNPMPPGGPATMNVQPQQLAQQSQLATMNAAAPVAYDYEGQQASSNLYNYQPAGDGSYYTYPPGMTAPQDAFQVSSSVPLSTSELDKYTQNLANPNQIDTRWWQNATPYEKDYLMGAYEDKGWDATYVDQLRQQAMPKYSSPVVGSFL